MSDFRKELNALGEIKVVTVNFGIDRVDVERMRTRELGGGATMDIGCYPTMFANFIFGSEKPEKIVASSQLLDTGQFRRLRNAFGKDP